MGRKSEKDGVEVLVITENSDYLDGRTTEIRQDTEECPGILRSLEHHKLNIRVERKRKHRLKSLDGLSKLMLFAYKTLQRQEIIGRSTTFQSSDNICD